MPRSPRPYRGAAGALLISAALAAAPASTIAASPSPHMGHMHMGAAMPEHASAALAALGRHATAVALRELRAAASSTAEPAATRGHAREASAAISKGDLAMARLHAANGAAVEHLTYALRALIAGSVTEARGHLGEAAALPKVASQARAALGALRRGNRIQAQRDIRNALKTANKD